MLATLLDCGMTMVKSFGLLAIAMFGLALQGCGKTREDCEYACGKPLAVKFGDSCEVLERQKRWQFCLADFDCCFAFKDYFEEDYLPYQLSDIHAARGKCGTNYTDFQQYPCCHESIYTFWCFENHN